ncbi:exported hypothetical protein [Candidatus Zixiibacteriota bacterium]|nr:exported hypothetical protein [candidate division Zixibacteria bacterium]
MKRFVQSSVVLVAIILLAAVFNPSSACDGAKGASASKSCPAYKADGVVKTASATSTGSCSATKGTAEVKAADATTGGCPYMQKAAEVKTANAVSGGSCSGSKGEAEVKTANAMSGDCPMSKVSAKTAGAGSCASSCASKGMTQAKMANAMGECDYKGNCDYITMNIKGMTCTGCENTVTEALKADKGVIKVVSVDYKTGKAVVCYDPSKVESAKLASLVTTSGYQAEVMPAVAKTTGTKTMKKGGTCDVLTGKCSGGTKTESEPTSH